MKGYNIKDVTYNMANFQNIEDFVQPLDAVRNIKVNDKLPLLFLDEFDCQLSNYPLLLPLLWDGELQVGHRDLKVGKLVIILAGSGDDIKTAAHASKGLQKKLNGGRYDIILSYLG